MLSGMDGFDELVEFFGEAFELPFDAVEWEHVASLMTRHHLSSYDALHIATAIDAGVPTIATLDSAFARVTGIQIVVVR